jgi:hypothetical protein
MALVRCERCGRPQGMKLRYAHPHKIASTKSHIFCGTGDCTDLANRVLVDRCRKTGVHLRRAVLRSSVSWNGAGGVMSGVHRYRFIRTAHDVLRFHHQPDPC